MEMTEYVGKTARLGIYKETGKSHPLVVTFKLKDDNVGILRYDRKLAVRN